MKNNLEFKHKAIVCDVHRNKWKEGDWTDDSDQMLMILMSITDNEGKVCCLMLHSQLSVYNVR